MTINEALKKAIKAGYNYESKRDYMAGGSAAKALILIDPEFWKALGEALNWNGETIRMCCGCGIALKWNEWNNKATMDNKHGGKNGCGSDIYEYDGQWLIEMHRLIDYLAEGKTAETFFKHLI